METYLVTGATGFIASHVIQQLLEKNNCRVRGTVRSLEKSQAKLVNLFPSEHFELVEADLLSDNGWKEAVEGCAGVFHLSSPNPAVAVKASEAEGIIRSAKEGSLRVLQACSEAETVKRVVLTSSVVAVTSMFPTKGKTQHIFTEDDWTNLDVADTYETSKTLAEQAAWEFMKAKAPKFSLVTVLPCYVQGPILSKDYGGTMSALVMKRGLSRTDPMIPKLPLNVCDVRDVATVHLRAMEVEEAGGKRFIVSSAFYWMDELHAQLNAVFKSKGFNFVTCYAPYPLLWLTGLFDSSVWRVLGAIGHRHEYGSTRCQDILGVTQRDPLTAWVDMGNSLIATGVVNKRK